MYVNPRVEAMANKVIGRGVFDSRSKVGYAALFHVDYVPKRHDTVYVTRKPGLYLVCPLIIFIMRARERACQPLHPPTQQIIRALELDDAL